MIRILGAVLLAGCAGPALAQHAGHAMPAAPTAPPPPPPSCTAEHAAMGHCELPKPVPAPAAPKPSCTAEHAAMGHCKLEEQPAPAASSCSPEHAAMGHCTMPAGVASSGPPVAPPPAAALSGPAHAADSLFGEAAMQDARRTLVNEHGNMRFAKVLIDQLEGRLQKGRDGYFLNADAWYGGDINKLWFKTEVEGDRGRRPEQAEVQALWSRAIDPWFDLQAGLRYDANPGRDRTHLVLGVQGLAPYWWEVDGALFLSNKGELIARAEAEYDLRITQKLILQPRVEADLSAQNIPELGMGAGLSSADAGVRLRYQLSQQFSPYLGLGYERTFGRTRDYRRAEGERAGGFNLAAGVRLWF